MDDEIILNPETFKKNLKRWSLLFPRDKEFIENTDCSLLEFCRAKTGVLNLKYSINQEWNYTHDNDDPLAEANKWFTGLSLNQVNRIYVFGLGLGYYFDAALNWLKGDCNRSLIFFEPRPEIIHRFLETEQAELLLQNRQTEIYLIEAFNELQKIDTITKLYASYADESIVTSLLSYSPIFGAIKAKIEFYATFNKSIQREFSDFGLTIFKNIFNNYLNLPRAYLASKFIDKFNNVPAIICGAGPSLDINIDVLATLKDRALIFGGGTALNALNARGVMPHFGVGIDPNPAHFTRLISNHAFELPFLYRARMLPEAIEMVHGDRLFVPGTSGYDIGDWIEDALGFKMEKTIEEGCNVLNFSLVLAQLMGCNPIICVGIDLAYSRGESYASGIISHPIHNRREDFLTKNPHEEIVSKVDINGSPIFTLWKWITESIWYGAFASEHPQVTLINATEGGIGFPNVPNMTLANVKEQFLNKQYDFSSRLHGEIQMSPFSSSVTAENIKEKILILVNSLNTAASQCEKIVKLYMDNDPDNLFRNENILQEIAAETELLEQEPCYKAILKMFKSVYQSNNALELLRIKLDAETLPENEVKLKRNAIDVFQYKYLARIAVLNNAQLIRILHEYNEKQAQIQKIAADLKDQFPSPSPSPSSQDKYSFDRQTLTLIDQEMNLDYNEPFSPKDNEIECQYYPGGSPKLEHYYRKGLLHGPSTFYHENGTLLARAWYLDGKHQGKMWSYYATGHLHSLQRFSNGLSEGVQQFYYPDEIPRSILPYKEGQLQGSVLLYHPSGQLFRRLDFAEGKRDGLEQMWNESGVLMIEAHYKKDHPVDTAKNWYPNGVLASEVIYDSDSKRVSKTTWDDQGKLLAPEKKQEDYFDKVTDKVDLLTTSLDTMLKQVLEVMPQLQERFPQQEIQNPEASNIDIDSMNKQMQRLHELNEEMQKMQAHGTEENPKESLWKSPATQKAVTDQLSEMGIQVNSDLQAIKDNLTILMNEMRRKDGEK